MSRFARASHVIWHCQYHLVWVPKYRFRMLQGPIWAKGYCVDMVGLNSEMIQKYVRFQEKEEQNQAQLQLSPDPSGPSRKGR